MVGLGATTSAAAFHLARRGLRVRAFDRLAPPHAQGSSHGESRIVRQAYFEGAHYLPLLERAYAAWRLLEEEAGVPLLHLCGGLMVGPAEGAFLKGVAQTAARGGLALEALGADDVARRFPGFRLPAGYAALFEPGAGWISPEAAVAAHLEAARRHGAHLHPGEPVLRWHAGAAGVQVTTPRGTYAGARLVLAAGAWLRGLVPQLPLVVERQVQMWFAAPPAAARWPIYIAGLGAAMVYGFPDLGAGMKAGLHHGGALVAHPEAVDRSVRAADEAALRAALARLLPGAAGPRRRAAVCLYTNAPDRDYVFGPHPAHAQVLLAAACSGHGFKASSALGEAAADWVLDALPADLAPFSPARLLAPAP